MMKSRYAGPVLVLVVAAALLSPIAAGDLPLTTLLRNLAERNHYPALEGLRAAEADVTSNILVHLLAVFPDASGKPILAKFYWSKPGPEAVPKTRFVFIGPEKLSVKAKQRWQITPDIVVNAPIDETIQIAKATSDADKITVSGLSKSSGSMKAVLRIDGSRWQVQELEMDLGGELVIQKRTNMDLGGKWVVESTVLSSPHVTESAQFEYTQVEGFWLPSRISIDPGISFQERDGRELRPPFVFGFSGWKVNKGIPDGIF